MGRSDLASGRARQQLATLLALRLEATGLAHHTGSKLPWKCLAVVQLWQDASFTPCTTSLFGHLVTAFWMINSCPLGQELPFSAAARHAHTMPAKTETHQAAASKSLFKARVKNNSAECQGIWI